MKKENKKAIRFLMSYAYHSDAQKVIDVARIETDKVEVKVIVDSGAFTAYTKGKKIDLGQYNNFIRQVKPFTEWQVQLDVIGDQDATIRNWERQKALGVNVVPVLTYGATREQVDYVVSREDRLICVGGLVVRGRTLEQKLAFLRFVMERIAVHGKETKIHALGLNSEQAFAMGVYSADSSEYITIQKFRTVKDMTAFRTMGIRPKTTKVAYPLGIAIEKCTPEERGALGILKLMQMEEIYRRKYSQKGPFGEGPMFWHAASGNIGYYRKVVEHIQEALG